MKGIVVKLKYETNIAKLQNCPPVSAKQDRRDAYRFVFGQGDPERSFLPVLIMKPSRLNQPPFQNPHHCCSGFALSFFDNRHNLMNRFRGLKQSNPNIEKSIGDRWAKLQLEKSDGLQSPISANGHFDLFEFEGVDLSDKTFQRGHLS